ncbi:MAG TPA: type II secretion system protein [Gaiellaceae bacterium]|nr:type II secretion system protein [Gaiellaceae bacterium]
MFDRIKTRLSSEQGFTLIELLVVIIILGILVAIAVPSYLSFRGNAQDAAAKANVRSAIPAAESWYQDAAGGNGAYTGLSTANLQAEAPGVSPDVSDVVVSAGGAGYCISDDAATGHEFYYIGGDSTDFTALAATAKVATISSGTCATMVTTP